MNKRMDNDAARFNRIKQPETSGTDNETAYRFFKHWRHFGVRSQMAQCEFKLADKSYACSLRSFRRLLKHWSGPRCCRFWRWPRRERSADIRSDLGQASNAGPAAK
jgi:hypothetical protein